MSSTFFGLELSKRALFAQQAGLNTVGQNVANANTPGYSRQRVNFEATPSMDYPGMGKTTEAGQMGTGVVAASIERVRDSYLDTQYREENGASGEWGVRQDTLNKLQALMNEPSDTGLSKVLDNFYQSWQSLGRNPDSLEARSVVKQAALDLCSTVNTLDTKLGQLDSDIGENVSTTVDQFNNMTSQISDLNKQITTLEVLGDKANDLRDKRDYLVDQISKMANVTTDEKNGVYTVSVGGTVVVNGSNPPVPLTYDPSTNTTSPPVTGGQIAGMMASRTDYVSVYRDQLNSMINGMMNGEVQVQLPNDYTFDSSTTTLPFDVTLPDGTVETKGSPVTPGSTLPKGSTITVNGVNGLMSLGYTMQTPTTKAGPLFTTSDGSSTFTAANIQVSQNVLDDVRNIAASYSTYTDSSGNTQVKVGSGDVAFMIGSLTDATIDFKKGLPPNGAILTKGTTSSYMRAMIGQLGAQSQSANDHVDNQTALLNQIDNMRQSVSGVSIDEEMSNMIKYQQSYSAAARMVTTMDSVLDTVVNRMAVGS